MQSSCSLVSNVSRFFYIHNLSFALVAANLETPDNGLFYLYYPVGSIYVVNVLSYSAPSNSYVKYWGEQTLSKIEVNKLRNSARLINGIGCK